MRLGRQHADGYAMAALLIAMTIMAIMMTVALPTWRHLAQREKEAELVFRGEQYARALTLFQNKNGPGTTPPSIDILVQQRYLRKKFKDPITNDDFVPLLQAATNPGTAAGPQRGAGAGTSVAAPATAQGAGRGTTGNPVGGIIGFTSKSKDPSILIYKGRTHYNEWQFVPAPRLAAPGAAGQGAGVGGTRGGGNRAGPQGAQNPFGGTGPFGPGGQRGPGRGPGGPGNPQGGPNNPGTPNRGAQPFGGLQPGPPRSGR
jgi:type II secretory pathway pseudopilin PulG